jgi:hypothetical protein
MYHCSKEQQERLCVQMRGYRVNIVLILRSADISQVTANDAKDNDKHQQNVNK